MDQQTITAPTKPATHTPGPWKATVYFDEIIIARQMEAAECPPIASITPLADHDLVTQAEDEANARLIASAPELLEELRRQVATMGDLHHALCLIGHYKIAEGCAIAHDSGAAVIRKATGA